MGDENPRIMFGVIITVYVDREMTTVRSLRARRKNERTWRRDIGRTRGYDRRANLLAYIRQLRAESLAGDSKCDGVESDITSERPNPKKKKKRWIPKMMSKFRLPFLRPFRRKNRTWRYRQFVPDEEEGEAKSKAYSSDIWKKLKHVVGGLSRGCVRSRRDS
ncbi:hypothetical protein EUTSA_v10019253mg [Eutrema salsugineum]|uniref:Uncharacterized protein n=1 Tax=Eutrema salsugineum TaxID=72664 RepID=V4M858_EUTSA|nr:uncharacterized protein LOC18008462 [Eutrema salsugineum]ESQ27341.1 hypothetical protein EUTSA_v10019253mg [Eutrema salsugineum]